MDPQPRIKKVCNFAHARPRIGHWPADNFIYFLSFTHFPAWPSACNYNQ